MQHDSTDPEEVKLRSLLRDCRAAPSLPPRFPEGVWSRIQRAEAKAGEGSPTWLDGLVGWLLRPRAAMAAIALLLVAGAVLGARDGAQIAKQDAEAHYLAVVAPNSLR